MKQEKEKKKKEKKIWKLRSVVEMSSRFVG